MNEEKKGNVNIFVNEVDKSVSINYHATLANFYVGQAQAQEGEMANSVINAYYNEDDIFHIIPAINEIKKTNPVPDVSYQPLKDGNLIFVFFKKRDIDQEIIKNIFGEFFDYYTIDRIDFIFTIGIYIDDESAHLLFDMFESLGYFDLSMIYIMNDGQEDKWTIRLTEMKKEDLLEDLKVDYN